MNPLEDHWAFVNGTSAARPRPAARIPIRFPHPLVCDDRAYTRCHGRPGNAHGSRAHVALLRSAAEHPPPFLDFNNDLFTNTGKVTRYPGEEADPFVYADHERIHRTVLAPRILRDKHFGLRRASRGQAAQ